MRPYYHFLETLKLNATKLVQKKETIFYKTYLRSKFGIHLHLSIFNYHIKAKITTQMYNLVLDCFKCRRNSVMNACRSIYSVLVIYQPKKDNNDQH
jgi:hypothetical protein